MARNSFPLHPDFIKLKDKWTFYLLAYEGGEEFKQEGGENYLYRHVRENTQDYKFRSDRAIFESISQIIINVWSSHIRRKGIERNEPEKKEWEMFKNNCDLENHNLDYFMLEKVFPISQACGFTHVVCDLPSTDIQLNSDYDRQTNEIRPYLVHYYPTDCINWKWKNGKFEWIIFKEHQYSGDADPFSMKKKQEQETNYKLWTMNNWYLLNENKKILDKGVNPFGEVPDTIFYNKESLIYNLPIGMSALKTIGEIDRKIFNLSSLLDEFLYRQCFAQLVLDKETLGKIIEMGTTRALPVDVEGLQPYFLEPPTGAGEFIVNERNRLIESAYRHAMVRGDNYMSERNDESGISKAYDLHDSNQNIANKSKNMESGENNIHRLLKKFHGEINVNYPINFDIKTLNEELKETIDIFKADIGSITYAREKAFNLVKRDLEKADPELLDKIKSELENGNPALDFDQRILGMQTGIFSLMDLIKQENPDAKESELQAKIKTVIEEKKQLQGKEEKPVPTLAELGI